MHLSLLKRIGLPLVIALTLFLPFNHNITQASTNPVCTATVEHIAGQGIYSISGTGIYSISGTGIYSISGTNGLTNQQEQEILNNMVGPEYIMQMLPSIDDDTNSMTEPVAVLVVDDFSYPGASHGYQVKEVVDDMAALLADEGLQVDSYAVDVSGTDVNYRMDALATELDNTINNLSSTYSHFVINMSFAAIPCQDPNTGFNFDNFTEEFEKSQDEEDGEATYNLEQYVTEEVESEEDGEGDGEEEENSGSDSDSAETYLSGLMTDPTYNSGMADLQNLLAGYVQEDPNQRIIIPVASSGNFAHWHSAEPFAPARWSETISVGASLGFDDAMWSHQADTIWSYSQPSDIVMPGAWYQFDDGNFRTGTSFAAPFASVATALYLTYPYDANFPCTLGEDNGLPLAGEEGWSNDWFFAGPLDCTLDDLPNSSTADATLTVNKTASTTTPAEGETVTFTLTVTNTGPETATRVKALDELARVGGLTYLSSSTTDGTYNPSNGIWWVGELAAGETATLTIDAQVATGTSGTDIVAATQTVRSDQTTSSLSDSVTLGVQ